MDAQAVQLMEPTIDQILEELVVSIMYRFLQSPIGYSRSVNTDTSNGCFRLQPMRKNSVRRLPQPRASAVDFPTRVCCFHRRPSASANSFSEEMSAAAPVPSIFPPLSIVRKELQMCTLLALMAGGRAARARRPRAYKKGTHLGSIPITIDV